MLLTLLAFRQESGRGWASIRHVAQFSYYKSQRILILSEIMKLLAVESLAIPEIQVIRFARFCDDRGYFTEIFRQSDFLNHPSLGTLKDVRFVQANESYSMRGVMRGLHFQWNPYMGKLVRTVVGHMVDLMLDIRKGSPTFGRVIAHDMPSSPGDACGEWLWVPPGFAHGNLFLQPTQIEYFCSGEYSPGCEAGISPLAADLDWSLCDRALKACFDGMVAEGAVLSPKDRDGLSLAAWNGDPRSGNFVYESC